MLLKMLPTTFKGVAKYQLKSPPPGAIWTWANHGEEFIQQFSPTSKVSRLKNNIANFQQENHESLDEAWERYKGLLRNCPQHNLSVQQKFSIFYDG